MAQLTELEFLAAIPDSTNEQLLNIIGVFTYMQTLSNAAQATVPTYLGFDPANVIIALDQERKARGISDAQVQIATAAAKNKIDSGVAIDKLADQYTTSLTEYKLLRDSRIKRNKTIAWVVGIVIVAGVIWYIYKKNK